MFSIQASKYIKEVAKSLDKFALTNFTHDITFPKKRISMLVSHESIFSFYYNNKIPTLCTDESGRTLAEGVYINKTLENSRKDCAILMPLLRKIGADLGQNFGKQSLHLIKREENCQHLYSLFFDLKENEFLHWIINNGNFVNDFVDNYNEKSKDIILEAKATENRITLPTSSDFNFSTNQSNSSQLKIFHKDTNLPIFLSTQQSRCLILLAEGKSTKGIASQMKLSPRTVEHYLEKIRQYLGCVTSHELMSAYQDQLKSKMV